MTDVRKKNRLKLQRRQRAHLRVRRKVAGTAERPRLSVFKSLRYVYAQLIDDAAHRTLATANSGESAVRERLSEGSLASRTAARAVGELLAERARELGVEAVVFDRGGYIYHGKVREIAEGARDKGLRF